MRHALLAAAAVTPLALAALPAAAQTTIAAGRTTPIATSAGGDVTITAAGTITLSSPGAAVTVDSNNSVLNQGTISANDVNGVTGILVNGGLTGRVENAGAITLTESYVATDSANGDSIVEAPFAKGTGRYGIRVLGPAPFNGDIIHSAGAITVKGDGSYGISAEAPITGQLYSGASVSLTGDGGVGVRETAGVGGAMTVAGVVTATGAQSSAVSATGDIGQRFSVYSALTSTGYSSIARPTSGTTLDNVQKTPADVQQGGSALVIAGNVGGGVFLGANGASTTDDTDGDSVIDSVEGTAAVTTYGTAPAMVIGAVGRNLTLGAVGTGDNGYGLIIRGVVSGQGVYDGVTATGLQLGVAGGGTLSIAGGVRVVGSIGATAYNADATAVHVLSGVSIPYFRNEGITAGSVAASVDAVTARALLIDAGANVPILAVSGGFTASVIGDKASAAAVVDRSGTVALLDNSGVISATIAPTKTNDATTGTTTAVDLSANTSGVVFRQEVNASGNLPAITGDVLLGSGPNQVQLLGGSIKGALSLGAAPSSFLIDNGATYAGGLSYGGSQLAVNVANGSLSLATATPLKLSSLNVGAASTVNFAVDAANNAASSLLVSGAATFASGAKIGVNVLTTSDTPTTLTLVSSPQLSLGTLDTSLLSSLPFLVAANLSTDTNQGLIQVTLRRRTAAELGLTPAEAPALNVVADGVNAQPAVAAALLHQTTQPGFASAFRQLLPDRGEGVFRFADQASREAGEATGEADDFADRGHAWVRQIALGFEQDADSTRERSRGGGFGGVAGLQSDPTGIGVVGVTTMFAIGDTEDPDRVAEVKTNVTELEAGLYWRAKLGGLRLEARGGAGYLWLSGSRGVELLDGTGATLFNGTTKNDHGAYTLTGRFGGSYELGLGRWFLRPQAHLDYFRLQEDAYTEAGGGPGVDLKLAERTGESTSGTGSLVFGAHFGGEGGVIWRPSVEVGVRDVFSGDTGALSAHYAMGSSFTLAPLSISGVDPMAKLKVTANGGYYEIGAEIGAEARSAYREGSARVTARFVF